MPGDSVQRFHCTEAHAEAVFCYHTNRSARDLNKIVLSQKYSSQNKKKRKMKRQIFIQKHPQPFMFVENVRLGTFSVV